MECSEEAWVIRITFMFSRNKDSNSLLENPGIPTIPLPSNDMMAILSI